MVGVAGCSIQNSGGDGGNGVAAVQPSQVTPEALQAAVTDERVKAFYQARNWQPAWNSETAPGLVDAIQSGAVRHGLGPRLFLADVEAANDPAKREAGLSLAAIAYAEALARGRVDPSKLWEVYELPRPDAKVAEGLNQALEQGQLAAWFDGLAPQDAEYKLLSQAYVKAARAATNQAQPLAGGATIAPGASDPRIPAIAARLRETGYLAAEAAAPENRAAAEKGKSAGKQEAPQKGQSAPARYTPEMIAAVRRLQEDHGIEPSGRIDEETFARLSGGALEQARRIAVNMERRRWLPREAAPTRIDVNTAAAELTYWRDGAVADRRRVVVGDAGHETPALRSPMFRLVANPTWTVPESIAEEELIPKGEAYLRRNNMSRKDGMIVQESGPKNSLGLVKFDMQNDHAIYLHDTPAKGLFASDERHASHGCVRVQDALGFAAMIAKQEGVEEEWNKARATGEETFVPLPRKIPVRLLYHTVYADGGRLRFRGDPYEWDEDVAEALGLAARPRRERKAREDGDLGP